MFTSSVCVCVCVCVCVHTRVQFSTYGRVYFVSLTEISLWRGTTERFAGQAMPGQANQGRPGHARPCLARPWPGRAMPGHARAMPGPGLAMPGLARQGQARPDLARPGFKLKPFRGDFCTPIRTAAQSRHSHVFPSLQHNLLFSLARRRGETEAAPTLPVAAAVSAAPKAKAKSQKPSPLGAMRVLIGKSNGDAAPTISSEQLSQNQRVVSEIWGINQLQIMQRDRYYWKRSAHANSHSNPT